MNSPGPQSAEVRLATRGVARSDRDYFAATLLTVVARDRWQKLVPDLNKGSFFVRQEAHFLPGVFVMGASVDNASAAKTLEAARNVLQSLISSPVLANELEMAKSGALAVVNSRLSTSTPTPWRRSTNRCAPRMPYRSLICNGWRSVSSAKCRRPQLWSATAINSRPS